MFRITLPSASPCGARFIEDLVLEQMKKGVDQYVIIGAGLDSFAERRPEVASGLKVFEIDKPETQKWKRERLMELGLGIPQNLKFVPVDFEAGDAWLEKLVAGGFKKDLPAVIASAGVSMYLTQDANLATFRQIAAELAAGSTFAMTFMLPTDLVDAADRPQYEMVQERAAASGTPFVSLFRPPEILELAREAGFHAIRHISKAGIVQRYFAGRPDRLEPSSGEEFLVVKVAHQ